MVPVVDLSADSTRKSFFCGSTKESFFVGTATQVALKVEKIE